jgi:hypothetical protein
MSAQILEMKSAESSAASVLNLVKAPLKVPAWSVVLVVALAGVYGYVSGRQNPVHHYVPYVGYPLVLDTTTGKACYSATPKPSENAALVGAAASADGGAIPQDGGGATGPVIPICGK